MQVIAGTCFFKKFILELNSWRTRYPRQQAWSFVIRFSLASHNCSRLYAAVTPEMVLWIHVTVGRRNRKRKWIYKKWDGLHLSLLCLHETLWSCLSLSCNTMVLVPFYQQAKFFWNGGGSSDTQSVGNKCITKLVDTTVALRCSLSELHKRRERQGIQLFRAIACVIYPTCISSRDSCVSFCTNGTGSSHPPSLVRRLW